ncbi:MAG: class I SAM-dependent methyltransferase [candidate division KSB1 bacterium]|nr:class I SAM-dependent methyltransferase [candidate division KSB1 bacterium]MDZ7386373.1 class I SAM-dependent methyltransferase [candidate division KSB1 bacterium]MDZ7394082.1 class I SAM-dependent methyltransferase [candidate division KSB1 bacterium]MDZ7411916.1 class I SAM-dependent methyltransferase [candidate division KSB1 bacterium]
MRTSERVCLALNRLFPARTLRERDSPKSAYDVDAGEAEEVLSYYAPYLQLGGKVVLDGGCGFGGKTAYCAQHGASYVLGLDNDMQHVRYARRFSDAPAQQNLVFMVGSLAALPFADRSFDVVLLNAVVEHIRRQELRRALYECKRVLKGGGMLCAFFPPWTSPSAAHVYDYIHIPWCQLFFSSTTLVNVLKRLNPAPRFGRLSYIDHFLELNRITISEFRQLVRELRMRPIALRQRMIKGMQFVRHVPILNRYLTAHVVAILQKDN